MTDINRINWLYDDFRKGMRKPIQRPKGKRKDIVDAIQTVYWCRGVGEGLGLNSVYQLERFFDGGSFKCSNGTVSSSHKWQKYSRGSNTPRNREVDLAESLVPGTAQQLRYVLWDVLKADNPMHDDIHQWLARLQPSVQEVLFKRLPSALGGLGTRAPVNSRLLHRLYRLASIDALAALVILLREAVLLNRWDLALSLVGATYQMLLILGMEFLARGIAIELFDVFRERIFSVVLEKRYQFDLSADSYIKASFFLNRAAFWTGKTYGKNLTWNERVAYMCDILEGKFGEDLRCAMRPIFMPLDDAETNFEKEMNTFRLLKTFQDWGWYCLDNGVVGKLRPYGLGLPELHGNELASEAAPE